MIYWTERNLRFACSPCSKGHRTTKCAHVKRPLLEIKGKGRPSSQCSSCRSKRLMGIGHAHHKCRCGSEPEREYCEKITVTFADGLELNFTLAVGLEFDLALFEQRCRDKVALELRVLCDKNEESGDDLVVTPLSVAKIRAEKPSTSRGSSPAANNPCDCHNGGRCICSSLPQVRKSKQVPVSPVAAVGSSTTTPFPTPIPTMHDTRGPLFPTNSSSLAESQVTLAPHRYIPAGYIGADVHPPLDADESMASSSTSPILQNLTGSCCGGAVARDQSGSCCGSAIPPQKSSSCCGSANPPQQSASCCGASTWPPPQDSLTDLDMKYAGMLDLPDPLLLTDPHHAPPSQSSCCSKTSLALPRSCCASGEEDERQLSLLPTIPPSSGCCGSSTTTSLLSLRDAPPSRMAKEHDRTAPPAPGGSCCSNREGERMDGLAMLGAATCSCGGEEEGGEMAGLGCGCGCSH